MNNLSNVSCFGMSRSLCVNAVSQPRMRIFDGFIRTQKERSWNRQRSTQDAAPLHQFCLIDSVGSFDRHFPVAAFSMHRRRKIPLGSRRSNFNDLTRAFATK